MDRSTAPHSGRSGRGRNTWTGIVESLRFSVGLLVSLWMHSQLQSGVGSVSWAHRLLLSSFPHLTALAHDPWPVSEDQF